MYIKIDLWEKQNKKSLWQLLTALKVRAESLETSQHRQSRPPTWFWGLFRERGSVLFIAVDIAWKWTFTFQTESSLWCLFWKKKKCNKLRGISPVSGFYLHITLITWSCLWGVKSSQWKHSAIRPREYKTLALHCPDQAWKTLVYFFSFVFFNRWGMERLRREQLISLGPVETSRLSAARVPACFSKTPTLRRRHF